MKGTRKKHNATFKAKVALVAIKSDRPCRSVAFPALSALPPPREPARKMRKCSPSPTSPQALQPTKDLMLIGADIETGRATP